MGKLGWFLGGYFLHSIFSDIDKETEHKKLDIERRRLELEKKEESEKDKYVVYDPNKKLTAYDWIAFAFWSIVIIFFIVLFVKVLKFAWLFAHIFDGAPK
ncbi:MAG: hypothetical protein J5798_00770 [Spirochaetaceae bacterium]|nr:hypothetical protein [Spirochaetaceae bacterium]